MDNNIKLLEISDPAKRESQLIESIAHLFKSRGWIIKLPMSEANNFRPDMFISRDDIAYAVEIKLASEGRADRLIPLWSQVYLQAKRAAEGNYLPLSIIAAPRITRQAAKQVISFAARHAQEAAVGLIDFEGLRIFKGDYLDDLNSERTYSPPSSTWPTRNTSNLFSDSYQWMLKVLLAIELPEQFLSAPRKRYENPSQLADAANVSIMTAFRFVQQLREEGYLHESATYLTLVRRRQLFERWRSAAARPAKEVPVRFIFRKDANKELHRILNHGKNCLGLFSAAEALQVGFVHGVPPYIYLPKLNSAVISDLKNIAPLEQNESPDLILRQPRAPKSVFRGVVIAGDTKISDILQIWIDVSSHPSRGAEQAELIERQVLQAILLDN